MGCINTKGGAKHKKVASVHILNLFTMVCKPPLPFQDKMLYLISCLGSTIYFLLHSSFCHLPSPLCVPQLQTWFATECGFLYLVNIGAVTNVTLTNITLTFVTC